MKVRPDLADRDQARVAGAAFELVGQHLQIGIARAQHEQRMDAERVGVAGALREVPHTVEVGRLHRRIDAQVHAERARQCPLLQARCAIRANSGASRWQWVSIHMPRLSFTHAGQRSWGCDRRPGGVGVCLSHEHPLVKTSRS